MIHDLSIVLSIAIIVYFVRLYVVHGIYRPFVGDGVMVAPWGFSGEISGLTVELSQEQS